MDVDWSALFGYDFFISYKRGDRDAESSQYAVSLRKRLEETGFRCFLDNNDAPAGGLLDSTIARGLRKSKVLIVVCTPLALRSPFVQTEIDLFAKQNKADIIPIDIQGCLGSAELDEWPFSVLTEKTQRMWIPEANSKEPSPETILKIQTSFHYRRANANKNRFLVTTTIVLAMIASLAIRQTFLSLSHGQKYALKELRVFGSALPDDDERRGAISVLERAFRSSALTSATKRELVSLRRNNVVGDGLYRSLIKIYDQHNIREQMSAGSRKTESQEPRIICSEALI